MDPKDQQVLQQIYNLGRTVYLRTMQYDKPMMLSIVETWKGGRPQEFAEVVHHVFRLLTRKAQEYEGYAREKGFTAADLFRYAAVAMLLGKSTWEMSLPQFALYLMQRGVEPDQFFNLSLWVEDFGILEYKWFAADKMSNNPANLTPDQIQMAEAELKQLQDRERFLVQENANLSEAADQLISEEKKVSPEEYQNDMAAILGSKMAIRSQLLAISYRQKLLLSAVGPSRLARQRAEAAAEQKRRDEEKATNVAYCAQSLDFSDPETNLKVGAKTVDPDDGSVSTVISIAVAQDNILSRHCYIREQLAQYFASKPQIYVWLSPPIDSVTPPLDLGIKLYQLPLGNIIITHNSYLSLVNPNNPTTQFLLRKVADNVRMGALNHTWGAFWDRTEPVYEAVPILEGNVIGTTESKVQEIKIPEGDDDEDNEVDNGGMSFENVVEYPALFLGETVDVFDLLPPDFDDYRGSILAFLEDHVELQHYPLLTYTLQPSESGHLPLNIVNDQIGLAIWRLFQYDQFFRYVRPEISEPELQETLSQLQQLYETASEHANEASLPQARILLDHALAQEERFLHAYVDYVVFLVGLALAIVEGRNTYVGLQLVNDLMTSILAHPGRSVNVRTLFAPFKEADENGALDPAMSSDDSKEAEEDEVQPDDAKEAEEDEAQPDDAQNMTD